MLDKNTTKNKFIMALLTATIIIATCIIIYKFNVPNPNIVLFVITAYVLSIHGYVNGTISAVIAFIYSLFFFSENHSFISFSETKCQFLMPLQGLEIVLRSKRTLPHILEKSIPIAMEEKSKR